MRTPLICCLTTAALILSLPAITTATPDIGQEDNGWSLADERALETYATASKELGSQAVGRNIVEDGWRKQNGKVVPASDAQIETWHNRLKTMLNPPEPTVVETGSTSAPSAPVYSSVPPSSAGTTSGGCPSYMSGEASTPTTYNAQGSGAAGCFQVMPATADAHGCVTDQATVPVSDQVECAQRICATSGDGAWVSADPCAYIGTKP